VSDAPQTIAALIQSLDAAIARLGEASSFKQRKARNQVVINRGLALYDRLQELQSWLGANWDVQDDPSFLTYLDNEVKYREGWKALTAAQEYTREYRKMHWSTDMSQGAPRRRRTQPEPKKTVPQTTYEKAEEEQAVML
jgi:hypothetical protein